MACSAMEYSFWVSYDIKSTEVLTGFNQHRFTSLTSLNKATPDILLLSFPVLNTSNHIHVEGSV